LLFAVGLILIDRFVGGVVDEAALTAELLPDSDAAPAAFPNKAVDIDAEQPRCSTCGKAAHVNDVCGGAATNNSRTLAERRAMAARTRFRRAMLENFRPLPSTSVENLERGAVAVQYWVYAPTKAAMEQQQQQQRATSATTSTRAGDDALRSAFGDAPMPSNIESDIGGGDGDDDAAASESSIGDAEWAADGVSLDDASATRHKPGVGLHQQQQQQQQPPQPSSHLAGSTSTAAGAPLGGGATAVHVDHQNASGVWPHPVFLRIERVLTARGRAPNVAQASTFFAGCAF
jgi:hypothetical protein